jgi:3-oxoacyl-(acyl-carrier-protein) synthase/acyl carrier protein
MLWQLLANQQQEDNLALRGEKTYVARLVNKDTPEFSQGLSLSSDGSYLITGGLGALGLHTAQWLVEKGAKNIVLTGRRPPTEKVSESIKQLEETGCQVRVLLGDVSVEADIGRILEQIQTSMPTLKGIIHAAGVTGEIKLLQELELSQLEAVLRPKVVGGWLLHQLTQKLELDFFVNFSSIASVWGSKGQAHYAAANHFLDGLTYYRRSLGTPSYSINWGPWSGGGMATVEAMDWLNKTGVKPLESEKAIVALEKVLVSNSPQTVVADMNWRLFKKLYELEGKRSLLSEIPLDLEATDGEGTEEQERQKQKVKTELLAKLEAASNEKRQEILMGHIREQVAQVLGLSSSKLPEVNAGFVEMGMDSLMAVELRNQLQKSLNCSVPTTLAFEYPNIISLTDYIYSKVLGWQLQEKEAQSRIEALEYTTTEPIAVVGMACRFPGGANSPEKLWQLLSDGVDAITEIPPQRWNVDKYYDSNPESPGKMSTRLGGFLQEDIAQFDPLFFGISEREAITIDPQHRLLLEVSWEALENTGYIPRRLDNSVTGVFVGITNCEYQVITGQATETNIAPYAVTGLPLNAAAGRLSYTLGLTGPSMAIDTACSSSLVAIHQACQSLRLQECQMALAGGVNLWLLPDALIATSQAQMSSPDGRCQTFDEEANGTAWGEGCGMLVLKRLSDAQASKDNILAVISGSAVNQDGPSSGFTVPNSSSQQQVIRQALKMAKVKPSQVSYVEAHGTATSLGDPIELRSLAEVFGEERSAQEPLRIGSIKTNIGHLGSAAGISGVMKVILQIQHRQIVPHLHLKNPTSKFDWKNSPIVVATQPTTWDRNEPSVAGVSSFGASGTNAHVIIEEAPAELRIQDITERPINLLTLSA